MHRRDKPRGGLATGANSGRSDGRGLLALGDRVGRRASSSCQPCGGVMSCSSARQRRSSKRHSPPEGEALDHLGCECQALGGTEASKSFERPSPSTEKSSLPRAMPCQHCAVAGIVRRRQLEGMWSNVLAGMQANPRGRGGGSPAAAAADAVQRVRQALVEQHCPRRQPRRRQPWACQGAP